MAFIIYSLPRSMSTWMAHFLYEKDRPCYHEKSQEFTSVDQIASLVLRNNCGIADTGLILLHKEFDKYPIKTVFVSREPSHVWEELKILKIPMPDSYIEHYVKAVEEYRGPIITFQELLTEQGVVKLCSLIGVPFDRDKYLEFKDTQIQPLVRPMLHRAEYNLENCKKLYKGIV